MKKTHRFPKPKKADFVDLIAEGGNRIATTPATTPVVEVLPPESTALTVAPSVTTWAKQINQAYAITREAYLNGIRRAVACGFLLGHVKEEGKRTKLIPHGEFGPWLEENCPEVSWRTVQTWMQMADGVAEILQIRSSSVFDATPLHQVLTLPDDQLSSADLLLRQQIWDLVDGKSQRQLQMQFKAIAEQTQPPEPKKEPTAKEKIAAKRTQALELAQSVRALHKTFSESDAIELLPDKDKNQLLADGVAFNNWLREKGAK